MYEILAPSSLKIKVEGRMIKIDQKLMEFFVLQSMIAIFQDIARIKSSWDLPAFKTGDFIHSLKYFSEHVIPERRKKRPYLSSILSKNEVVRQAPYNRKLFVRVRLGRYILNPSLEIEMQGQWINLYDLIGISAAVQRFRFLNDTSGASLPPQPTRIHFGTPLSFTISLPKRPVSSPLCPRHAPSRLLIPSHPHLFAFSRSPILFWRATG